jgi:GTP-binding protein EngB required for normal cell division
MCQNESTTILLTGQTQVGKSSFINLINGEKIAPTGKGLSCTLECNNYYIPLPAICGSQKVLFVDSRGWDDTNTHVSNNEIKEQMGTSLMKDQNATQFSAILCFESLSADSIQLSKSLANLVDVFGTNVLKSTIVVLTKGDLLEPDEIELRIKLISKICTQFSVKAIVWNNKQKSMAIQKAVLESQLQDLKQTISQIIPYQTEEMKQFAKSVEDKAKKLHDADQVKVKVKKPVTTQEAYSYPENVTQYRDVVKNRREGRPVERVRNVQRRHSRDIKFGGIKVDHRSWVVNEPEVYTEIEYYDVPYTEKEVYEAVVYKYGTRTVTKEIEQDELEERFPIEHYIRQVRKEIALSLNH